MADGRRRATALADLQRYRLDRVAEPPPPPMDASAFLGHAANAAAQRPSQRTIVPERRVSRAGVLQLDLGLVERRGARFGRRFADFERRTDRGVEADVVLV